MGGALPPPTPRTNAFAHTWGLAMVTAEATSGNQGPRPDRPSRMKPYVGGLAMALLLATCTNAGEGSTANQGRSPRECQANAGAATDLASEPDWASYGRYERWHDGNGCALRVDVVGDHLGPEHCGWTSVRLPTLPRPPGDRSEELRVGKRGVITDR